MIDSDDWVAFDEAKTFQPAGIERAKKDERSRRRPKKRHGKRRSERESSETGASTKSWMEKPIDDDSSWLPVEPPRYTPAFEARDDDADDSQRSNTMSRPPRIANRTSSVGSEGKNQSSTSLASRARERARAKERRPSRGRAAVETRDQPSPNRPRGRSSSRTRTESPSRNARSSSRNRVETVSNQRGRVRSTSRTRVASPSPSSNRTPQGASPSPRRIPLIPPMPNTEPRGRIPVIPPMPNTEPRGRSTSRTQPRTRSRTLSRSRIVASLSPRSNSSRIIGGRVPPRHAHSFGDRSVCSEQLGVAQQGNGQMASAKKFNAPRKEGGLLERFFGDQVSEEARNNYRNSIIHSATSVGSLGTAQGAEAIHPRVLLSATVYKNAATNLWIATINTNQKGVATNPKLAAKYLKAFSFASELEAREAAIANAPPKMMPFEGSQNCFVCKGKFAVFRRARHCRNCGACVCGACTTTWSSKMLPETYNLKNESVVRVCKSCSHLTDSFRKALLKGDLDEAIELYHTGNINLRCPLPPPMGNKKDEIMYPIHCAVQGGNLDIVRWLMDEHFCPIKLVKKGNGKGWNAGGDTAIVTSKGRSVLNIAMNGLKVDIIRYLVVEKGAPVYETKDLQLSLRALEAVLLAFPANHNYTEVDTNGLVVARWDQTNYSDDGQDSYVCSSLGDDQFENIDDFASFHGNQPIETADLCILCYDRNIDSVILPCGHTLCCLTCSKNLKTCPVCNVECSIIQIFKP